ncbi:hypothetical protein B4102_3863 [Heyndrickxia sporothermodurans]|uniref:MgtC/SapB/SrpB/YhiD N-terminal domain-containing protein n=2 Tax=Heyndrickxia sporothermodurans TaxID=46224 RepID=A0A150KLB3_9BACI|nr:hypothetical protein B4102_3863 [Heyndrickxia sporothermodurans]
MQVIMENFDIEMIVKLLISAILGLAIGLERELKRKPLGLKTSLVISIVSCLLTIVSIQAAYLFPASDVVKIQMDPLRLAAQIVSGIGFLGAGVILRKEDDTISGLTTAAMVWGAAGIGIATGAGFYIEAIAGVVLLIVSVELIPVLIKLIGFQKLHSKEISLKLILKDRNDIRGVIQALQDQEMTIDYIHIKELDDQCYLLDLKVQVSYRNSTSDIYEGVSKIDTIYRTEISG